MTPSADDTKPAQRGPTSQRSGAIGFVLGALALLIVFRIVGHEQLHDFALDLGSLYFPAPRHAAFVMTYVLFGGAAALLMTWGLARALRDDESFGHARARWLGASDARFVARAAGIATLLAALFHFAILRGSRLTDDEAAYQYMAELLASGRLYGRSPPMKLFFDNAFMINDGRLYSKYLLGWPILLAPGQLLGIPGLMNALYFGLTIPPLYRVLRAAVGAGWARAGVVVFIAAPMLLIGAATMMSHTSCICALAWAWDVSLRAREPAASPRLHAAFGALLGLAVLIRPTSAIGIGTPLAIAWLTSVVALPARDRLRALVGFALAGGALAALALAINAAQTGNPFLLAYARMDAYHAENAYRFAALPKEFEHTQIKDVPKALGMVGVGLLRLSFALLGWPCGLALGLLALGDARAKLAWSAGLGFTLVHLPMADAGIDTFGPVHWYEIALPILVVTMVAFARIEALCERLADPVARAVPASMLMALVLVGWTFYLPVVSSTLGKVADDIRAPLDAVQSAQLRQAVIFAPRPWGQPCYSIPTHNYAFFRPNNDPNLENDVLWVNNLGLQDDKELMKLLPNRTGYILVRLSDCTYRPFKLDEIDPKLAEPIVDDLHNDAQRP